MATRNRCTPATSVFLYALATSLLGGPKSLGYLRRLARQAHHLRRSFAIPPEIRLNDRFLVLAHLGFEQRPCKSEKASPPGHRVQRCRRCSIVLPTFSCSSRYSVSFEILNSRILVNSNFPIPARAFVLLLRSSQRRGMRKGDVLLL
jgi:hypothetical protein